MSKPFVIRPIAAPSRPRITAATRRRLNQRRQLWPEITDAMLWDRNSFVGFTTIPRTLPLVLRIIDELDRRNAGRVFFDLWSRAFDDFVVEVRDEFEAAYASGYSGQRAVRSWRERVGVLETHGFVKTHKMPHGAYRFILILEPHQVIRSLEAEGKVSQESSLLLQSQLITIGAVKVPQEL